MSNKDKSKDEVERNQETSEQLKENAARVDPTVDPAIRNQGQTNFVEPAAIAAGARQGQNSLAQGKSKEEVKYFRFIGRNADGYVAFERGAEKFRFPTDGVAPAPAWLAAKLDGNPEFEEASEEEYKVDQERDEKMARLRAEKSKAQQGQKAGK